MKKDYGSQYILYQLSTYTKMCYCVLYLGYEVLELTCDGPVVLDAPIIFTGK